MSSVKAIIIIAAFNIYIAKCGPRDLSFLARICIIADPLKYVFCLGVYVGPQWILTNEQCIPYIQKEWVEVIVLMGSNNVDCDSGQQRKLAEWNLIEGKEYNMTLIKIADKFSERPGSISMIQLFPEKPSGECIIYCTFKALKYISDMESEGKNQCYYEMEYTEMNITKCNHTAGKNSLCGTPGLPSVGYDFSPVVCDGKLAGFLTPPDDNGEFIMAPVVDVTTSIQKKATLFNNSYEMKTNFARYILFLFIYYIF